MAAAAYFDQIQKIYIAFYQRPADPAGLLYWAGKADDAGGDLGQIINAFAASPEANTLYGAIDASTIGGVIDSLYLALFNRAPEPAGRQFYIDSFAAGTFTPSSIALAVLVGAQERDSDAIGHKLQVANEFTQQVDGRPLSDPAFGDGSGINASYAGSAAEAAARAILAGVTADPTTVLTPAQVTGVLQEEIAQPGDPILDGNTGGGGGDTGGGSGGDTGGGGGSPAAPTFSVALDADTGALTFAGTATGTITFSVDASGNVTFTRAGVVAADTVALSAIHSAPTGITLQLSATAFDLTVASASTLKTADWIDFASATYRIKDSTANILAELNSTSTGELKPGSPLAQASAIVATDAMTAAQFAIPGLAERMAEGSVTLDLGTNGATPEQLALIVTHIDKVADGGITGTLKLAKLGTGDESGYFSALLGKAAADATVNVAAEGMTAAELITLSEYIAKVDTIAFLTLTKDQSAQEIANLLSKAISAEIDLSGMDAAQLGAILDNASGLADDSLTAITLTGAQLQVLHDANALGKLAAGSVTVSGALSDMEKALVIAQIGKIAEDGISAITLTVAEATIALLEHAALADGSVTIDGQLDLDELGALLIAGVLNKIAEGGITALTLEALADDGEYVTADQLPIELLAAGSITWGRVTADNKPAALTAIANGKVAEGGITAITLTEDDATAAVLGSVALKDGSVTIGAVTGTSQAAVLAALDKMAAEGITAITLTTQQATAEVLSHPAFKNGSVTLNGTVDQAYLDSLGSAASKLATGSITGMTFANDAELQAAAQLVASDSVDDNAIALTDGAITTAKATVLANLGKFQDGQITTITLTDAEAKVAGILVSDVLKAGSVTIGAVTDSKALVLVNLGKIADGGIGTITLTKVEANTLLAQRSSVLQDGSVTISDGVDLAFLNSLADPQLQWAAKMAPGGISAITLTKEQASTDVLNNPLVNDGSVTISDAVDKAYLDTLEGDGLLAKIAVGGITKITLTEAQATADFLANPILKAKSVTIGAVTDTSKEVVLGTLGMIATDGITAITLTKSEARAIGTTDTAAFKDKSVTIEEKISGISDIPISQGKIAVGGIKQFDATGNTSFSTGYFSSSLGNMYAQRSVTFGEVKKQTNPDTDHRVNQNAQQAVLKGLVAKGGITAIDLSFQGAMRVLYNDKEAFKDGAITVGATGWADDGGIGEVETSHTEAHKINSSLKQLDIVSINKLATSSVLQYIDHFEPGQITSFTFTKDQATATLLGKAALAEGSVTLSDAVDAAYLTGLSAAQLAKIAEGGITAITLTPAQATAQLLASAALKDGSVTLSGVVDAAYLSALSPAQQAKFAEGGYRLSDTLAHLQALSADALAGASSYTLTDAPATLLNLTPAQIALVQGASNATAYDVVAPAFASVSSSGNTVVLTFSEAITAGEGNIVIKSAADGSTVATIAVADATINGKSLSVTLQAALTADASYYVEVAAGVVKDTVGNAFAGIADATTAGFTATVTPFDVTREEISGVFIYRVGTGHGAVEVTWTRDNTTGEANYTFKPEQGTAKTVTVEGGAPTLLVEAPLILTGTAEALQEMMIIGSGSVTVRGSEDYQKLNIATTGSNTIEAGSGADLVELGDGADKVVIKGGASGTASDSIPASYDTIMFFDLAHDTIALPTTDTLQSGPHTLPNNGGSLDTVKVSFGVVTEFDLYGGSGNLENKINAVLGVLGDNKAAVAFVHDSNTYVLYGDGVAGTQSSDIVVQLMGVVGVTSLGFSASSGTLVLA